MLCKNLESVAPLLKKRQAKMYFSTSEVIGGDPEVESKNGFRDANIHTLYIIPVKFG